MNGIADKKPRVKNDIIFISVLLAVIIAAGALYMLSRSEGDTVTVTVGGAPYGEYPLSTDRTVEIKNGEAVNLLIIEGGKARVEYASCPDGVCVSHKPRWAKHNLSSQPGRGHGQQKQRKHSRYYSVNGDF